MGAVADAFGALSMLLDMSCVVLFCFVYIHSHTLVTTLDQSENTHTNPNVVAI